jgi:hypothetical protein
MKPMFQRVCAIVLLSSTTSALAGVVIVPSDGEVTVPIHAKTGSLVQLPDSVKVISPSQNFEIVDVGANVDPITGAKTDVRLFQIRSVRPQAEAVTFILGNGSSVKTKLLPSDSAETYYDLVSSSEPRRFKHPTFMQAEVALMSAMIRDEAGAFARQVKDAKVSLSGFDGVSAKLIRIFAGNDLLGYTFEIRNTTRSPLSVDVRHLGLGKSQGDEEQAILVHAEAETLGVCPLFSQAGCSSRVFVVARDGGFGGLRLQPRQPLAGIPSQAPFVPTGSDVAAGGGAR